jgi:N-acetyl-gamma-glutamyl-phosphate reductase
MIRVGILGATGYTALELLKILLRHDDVQVTALTTRQQERPHLSEVHPQLMGRLDLCLEPLSNAELSERCDCVFACLPHCASAAVVPELLAAGTRVVDLSADYRLRDVASFRQWYKEEHPDPERVGKTVYGLPELFREQIIPADLIANPGCYTTTSILPLAALLNAGLIQPNEIIIDAKSGASGAGRTPKANLHFVECNESFSAYGVGTHRHTPEIDQILSLTSGQQVEVVFTPHLVPMDRGILATIYARPTREVSQAEVIEVLRSAYADEPFVRVSEALPTTKQVALTNFCDMTARMVRGRIVVLSCLDNLIKGASGQAVQNFNLMHQLSETKALY